MGGTTAKACIVDDGLPVLTTEYEFRDGISAPSRFIKGGGYMLKVPAVDLAEVGAGGGSIATVDSGGLLTVGPRSAGADPGPACYGRGNDVPTVTDANMVRSEEHTSELQSLMRISYAVFCLKKKKTKHNDEDHSMTRKLSCNKIYN